LRGWLDLKCWKEIPRELTKNRTEKKNDAGDAENYQNITMERNRERSKGRDGEIREETLKKRSKITPVSEEEGRNHSILAAFL
jgi:hypothetical protein